MKHPFRLFIEKYSSLSPVEWEEISVCLEREEINSGNLILEEGKVCRHLYFLESGLLRFFINRGGEEVTKFFTEAPYLCTSQQSFSENLPAKESIEALEDSVIWRITAEDTFRLLTLPGWNLFIRKLTLEVQKFTEEILEEIQTTTAEQRYRILLEQQSSLVRRVPLKYLASYLGIAPQSLSRIRKKMIGNS
ncbi:MAG: Crp/Fnr family transcriptional regulator [Bacteroidia bacterium]|nr:Crp/Fnr family transcriptional regulator [Bacteroidia bacterium]